MPSLWELVGDAIPNDHARQVTAYDLIREELAKPHPPATVVDLGCGDARSAAVMREVASDVRWIGLDVEQSPYASQVQGEDVRIYDGVHVPFADDSVPAYFSCQVFEHVRYPEVVLAEIARTLEPGGLFIGSTSQLEPYHEYSLWNYTIYGFRVLVEAAGLELAEVRPGIDGPTLIRRQYEGRPKSFSRWFSQESPLNVEIDEFGATTGRRPALVNHRKLQFCGQFAFRVRKPLDWVPPRRVGPADVAVLGWDDLRRDAGRLLTRTVRRRLRQSRTTLAVRSPAPVRALARSVVRARRGR